MYPAQYELSIRGDCNFRDLNLIREAIISEIQQGVVAYDFRMINEAETIIRNLVRQIRLSSNCA